MKLRSNPVLFNGTLKKKTLNKIIKELVSQLKK